MIIKEFTVLFILLFLVAQVAAASQTIYFLRKGEVWQADAQGKNQKVLTHAEGLVRRFLFSPKQDYLAYEKIVG